MVFYVPLGVRGVIFRIGTLLISVGGGLAYWRASRRRLLLDAIPVSDFVVDAPIPV